MSTAPLSRCHMHVIMAALTCAIAYANTAAAQTVSTETARLPDSVPPLTGTLFMTPAERDRLRAPPAPLPTTTTATLPAADAPPPPPARSVLNGFVKRSDGVATIWVDGKEKTGLSETLLNKISPESVGGSSETLRVKVGAQTDMKATGPKKKMKRRPYVKPPSTLRPPALKRLRR